jgi:nucleoside-diphosphate-sugar epimerase
MKHRTFVMTGGTGFLGSLLGVELLSQGYKVFFLGRRKDPHNYETRQRQVLLDIDPNVPLIGATFLEVDFESETLGIRAEDRGAMMNADGLFHFAADVSFRSAHEHRVRKTNLGILPRVMMLAHSLGIPFYFVSTAYVHGKQKSGFRVPEEFFSRPSKFHNAYEESKYDAEYFVKDWTDKNNLSYAIFRPSIVVDRTGKTSTPFGFSSFLIGIEKMKNRFPRFMSGALNPLRLPFPYSPRACLNLVPADWVIHAIIAISERGDIFGKIFNLTNPQPVTSKKIIDHAFGKGSGVKLHAFPAPEWLVNLTAFLFYVLGFVIPPLKVMSERVWLFRFNLTEANHYAMNNTNEYLTGSKGPKPTLTDEELTAVARYFIGHYNRYKKFVL